MYLSSIEIKFLQHFDKINNNYSYINQNNSNMHAEPILCVTL